MTSTSVVTRLAECHRDVGPADLTRTAALDASSHDERRHVADAAGGAADVDGCSRVVGVAEAIMTQRYGRRVKCQ